MRDVQILGLFCFFNALYIAVDGHYGGGMEGVIPRCDANPSGKVNRQQSDQIGRFFKVFGKQNSYKSCPNMIGDLWANLKRSMCVKLLWMLFRQLLEHLGNYFTPTSGHSDGQPPRLFFLNGPTPAPFYLNLFFKGTDVQQKNCRHQRVSN